MSVPRAKKAPTAEQLRKNLTKRIGEQFKIAMYTAVEDLRAEWERADLIVRADIYQTADNLKAGPDDKMVVREIATIVPAVYEMLWVLCNGLISECNRAEFPAGFAPSPEAIAEHLDECVSEAVTPSLIRFSGSLGFGPAMTAFADPAQTVQNSIRGQLTTLVTREILVAMLPKIFVEFLKSLAVAAATFVWYDIQCKPTFVASRVDEGLVSAILTTRGFPAEIVDRMFGGITPKVKKAAKAKKTATGDSAPATTDAVLVATVDEIGSLLDGLAGATEATSVPTADASATNVAATTTTEASADPTIDEATLMTML